MRTAWLPKEIALALLSFSLLLQTSCDKAPPDVPACEHFNETIENDPVTGHTLLKPAPICMEEIKEPRCGHCIWIVSKKVQYVGEKKETWLNGKPWSQLRDESVLLPAEESYGPVSAHMINQCKKLNCSDEVDRFKIKLNVFNLLEKSK